MGNGFHGYDGPSIDLSTVTASIRILRARDDNIPPTKNQLIEYIREKMFSGLPESYVETRVTGALGMGQKEGIVIELNNAEKIRYDLGKRNPFLDNC